MAVGSAKYLADLIGQADRAFPGEKNSSSSGALGTLCSSA